MNLTEMDIKTIITLLSVGNFAVLAVLAFYRNIAEHRRPYWHFMAGKLLQTLSWLLLGLRGAIPDLASAHAGNTLLLSGFALEAFSLTTVGRPENRWASVFSAIAVAGIAVFWIFAATPSLWVGYATTATMALFLPAFLSLVFAPASSGTRRFIGLFYGVTCLILAFRAWSGFTVGSGVSLLSRNLIQTLSFANMFLLLVVSGSGFLLLFKEEADRRIGESEKKYRTLVEKANEAICIVQDGKVAFANEKTQDLLGLSLDWIVGRPYADFIFPADLKQVAAYESARTEPDRDAHGAGSFRVTNPKGEPVWVLVSATPIEYGGRGAILALMTNIDKLKRMEKEHQDIIGKLQEALADVNTLSGLLPICAFCKKIQDDKGNWSQIEVYIRDRSAANFSHGMCPDCAKTHYPDIFSGADERGKGQDQ